MKKWCPPPLGEYRLKHAKEEHLCEVNVQKTWPHYATYLFPAGESWNIVGQSICQNFPDKLC